MINRDLGLYRLGLPLAILGPAQIVRDDGAIGELLQGLGEGRFSRFAGTGVLVPGGGVFLKKIHAGPHGDHPERRIGEVVEVLPRLGPIGVAGILRLVGRHEVCRHEIHQQVRRFLASGGLLRRGTRGFLDVHASHVKNRDDLRGICDHGLEILGQQLPGDIQLLARLVGAVIGLHVIQQSIVLIIGLGILLRPGVQVLQQLGPGLRPRVFQDVVENVVFALILNFLLGLRRRGRRLAARRLRAGALCRPRHDDGKHNGDSRYPFQRPIKVMHVSLLPVSASNRLQRAADPLS